MLFYIIESQNKQWLLCEKMNKNLLIDMFYAAPEFWYVLGGVFLAMLIMLCVLSLKVLKAHQRNYFLNRDRERYAETLYASKDGYFAFVYPDENVNDPRQSIVEHCSRRLAVIMNMPQGTSASFEDILKNFYKDDAKKILKYVELLREDGVSFEDDFELKNPPKRLRLSGSKINGLDGNTYCDMIWFRDISFEINRIAKLELDKNTALRQVRKYEDLINNIPYPVWLRNESLALEIINKKYMDFVNVNNPAEVLGEGIEINNVTGESISKSLAQEARSANRPQSHLVTVIKNGERLCMEAYETPFHFEQDLNQICTAGALIDRTELDSLKRDLKAHQGTQLEILGALDKAFAVFDSKFILSSYNNAFGTLWKLEPEWLESQPTYAMFLDMLHEKKLLPEVTDLSAFKDAEQKAFSSIIEPQNDYLFLPDGRTLRRVRSPNPLGGLVFAYEDVSDNLATTRAYNLLKLVQKESLNNLFDAVVIFSSDGRLNFYNEAYIKLWKVEESFLKHQPGISELIESQRPFFRKAEDWKQLKEDILEHIIDVTTPKIELVRDDGEHIAVLSKTLPDDSIMITYQKL